MSDKLDLKGLKQEMDLIAKVHNLLLECQFGGKQAQDVAIAQMYTQNLHAQLKAKVDEMEKAALPVVEANKPVVVKDSNGVEIA